MLDLKCWRYMMISYLKISYFQSSLPKYMEQTKNDDFAGINAIYLFIYVFQTELNFNEGVLVDRL